VIPCQIWARQSGYGFRLVADLADQELRSLGASLIAVAQVSSSDSEGTSADEIANSAEDLSLVTREVRDSTTVLEVLSVSEQNSANSLVANSGAGVADSSCGKSGTLRVTTCNELGVGAFGVGQVREADHLGDGLRSGTARHEVTGDGGVVGAADTLDPDVVGTVLALESVTERRAKSSLEVVSHLKCLGWRYVVHSPSYPAR
jgi:hypothetical protein